jgi:predicted dehydrogenase
MSAELNYGFVGCGMMGQEHIRNLNLMDGSNIAGIFEPDGNMRQDAATIAPNAKLVSSIQELLEIESLDCVVIASPNNFHLSQFEEIFNTRPLPLMIEKPLFTNPVDNARISYLLKHYPEPVWVAMEYRYMPPITYLLDNMEAAAGNISMVSIKEHRFPFLSKVNNWNRFNQNSGGTFVEKCCHFFDLMRLITKSEAKLVMALAGQATNHKDEIYDGRVPDIDDHGYVIIEFENGMKGMLELCMFAEGSRYQEEISVIGKSGKIEALVPGPGRFWQHDKEKSPTPKVVISPRKGKPVQSIDIPINKKLLDAGDHNGATYFQHENFFKIIREKSQPEVSLKDGYAAVKIAFAAQKSAATGKSVEMQHFF